ncbi:MAG: redox-sensing transcriptional repressor Rex [Acidobacteriota bacterium]
MGSFSKPPPQPKEAISELTTGRLSIYLRCLSYLESQGEKTVSSHELASRFHLNSSQIRKDLAYFGELGIRGVGYDIRHLKEHLVRTLGMDQQRVVVIAGAGNLGVALANYRGFNSGSFQIAALLDSDPKKFGRKIPNEILIEPFEHLEAIVRDRRVEIGIIAVPAESAQHVFDRFADAGICAILNFAPVQVRTRERVKLRNVDLRIHLETLSFFLQNAAGGECASTTDDQPFIDQGRGK